MLITFNQIIRSVLFYVPLYTLFAQFAECTSTDHKLNGIIKKKMLQKSQFTGRLNHTVLQMRAHSCDPTNLGFEFLKLSFPLLPVFLYLVLGLFFSLFQATCFPCNSQFCIHFLYRSHLLPPVNTGFLFSLTLAIQTFVCNNLDILLTFSSLRNLLGSTFFSR
jgi:hypothetical protein